MNQLVVERAARRTAAAERRAAAHAASAHAASAHAASAHAASTHPESAHAAPRPGAPSRAPGGRFPRTAVGDGRLDVPAQPHEWRTLAAVSVGVLVVLLAATWSFAQGWGRGPVVGPGEIAVGSGVVRVDGVVSAAPPQHAMPGMGTDEDPVPAGHRRVSVDVTLMAGTDPLRYAGEDFGLTVDGEVADRLPHRDILPGDVLPAGTRLSGTILFDVPADATTATLTYDGAGSTDVVLPAEEEQPAGAAPAEQPEHPMTGAGHGGDGHATTETGTTTGARTETGPETGPETGTGE